MFKITVISFIFVLMFIYYAKCNNFLKSAFFGVGSGILSLGIIGIFAPNLLNFNIFIILMSAIAGIPGVITLILLNQFLPF